MNEFREILESLNIGIIYSDNNHIIQYMDQKASNRFMKSGGASLVGRNLMDCHNEAASKKILFYQQQMREGNLEEVQVRKSSKGNAYMKAVRNSKGELIGYLERFERNFGTLEPTPKENLNQKSAIIDDELAERIDGDRLNKCLVEGLIESQIESQFGGQIEFYKQIIPPKSSVLELGCGTGRIALDLAKRGNDVVGIDLSKEMLNELNSKIVESLKEIKGNIKTVQGEIINFNLDRKFDVIIFPNHVFQMLLADKFRDECLHVVKKHLNSDGMIIIDIFDPVVENFLNWNNKKIMSVEYQSAKLDARVRREVVGDKHFEQQQIISYRCNYEIIHGHQVNNFIEPMRLCYLNQEQSRAVFERNQLEVKALYGGYDFSMVREDVKKELIFVLKLM